MARLRAGILGQLRGKVAGVVGAQWKDKNYIREYVKPANPNTAAQQVQRARMYSTVGFCKPIVGPVFNVYTDRFQKSMSGFNFFIKRNIARFTPAPSLSSVRLTEGKLSAPGVTSAVYTTGTGNTVITFTTNYGNNGAATDKVFAALYHAVDSLWFFPAAEVTRDTLTIEIAGNTGMTVSAIHTYLWAARYANTLVDLICYSTYKLGEAP